MTFFIDNIHSLFYIFLITTQQINDLNFIKLNIENSNIKQTVADNESTHQSLVTNTTKNHHMKQSISLIPCGDFTDFKPINDSVSFISLKKYKELLQTRSKLTNTLNQIKLSLKKISIINIVQEKKLGKNGNSIYFQKSVKKLNISVNDYAVYHANPELNPVYFNPNESKCDFVHLTLYDPETSFMVRKIFHREFFNSFKRDNYNKKTKKTKSNLSSFKKIHPILEYLENIKSKANSSRNKMNNIVDMNYQNYRFYFKYGLDTIKEINHLYKTYLKLVSIKDDFVLSYAIIQKKATGELYLHLKTNSGITYLNYLELFSNKRNNFIFRFKKSSVLTFRIKSMELWRVLKYENYVPSANCSQSSNVETCLNEQESIIKILNQRSKNFNFIISTF